MNNFPEYSHHLVELVFEGGIDINEKLADSIADRLISELSLTVVGNQKHIFDNGGLTKIWILSQSHLVIHTWPEWRAIHLDLMTCGEMIDIKRLDGVLSEIRGVVIGIK